MNEERSHEQAMYRYRFGTAEFDEARFELRVAGLPVEVERRALEVLDYLLRHAGEVVTKEELFREVWAGRVTVDKVLPNAITKLRRALGEANAERLLTQPRIGYRLDGTVERIALGRRLSSRLELAPDQPVPTRDNFILQRQLGSNRGSEVWLAEHAKTHERRVYKFAADDGRLRALKREATLSRVLHESLEDRTHFVDIIDWNFENPPFFLECNYGGENLLEWAKTDLSSTSQEERIALFLQIADAVAAAHGVGVLHKDLKPANVLIAPNESGWQIRLTDFGSGRLLDPDRLEELGITRLGLTITQSLAADSSTGTPLYIAPEVFAGHAPTVQSDVFALGIMLYQLLAGNLTKPMASGWEQDISDELLREDIRLATDGNPARRLTSVAELATRLRGRDERQEQMQRAQETEKRIALAQQALARSRARRPYLVALLIALTVGIATSLWLCRTTLEARDDARFARDQSQHELERANAINRFLNEDLVDRSNRAIFKNGQNTLLKDALLAARENIPAHFSTQPLAEASIHLNLGMLFRGIDMLPEAEAEHHKALNLFQRETDANSSDSLKARAYYIADLISEQKTAQVSSELSTLDYLTAHTPDLYIHCLTSLTWADYAMSKKDYSKAVSLYQQALDEFARSAIDDVKMHDWIRLGLIRANLQSGHFDEVQQKAHALIDELKVRRDNANPEGVIRAKEMLARVLISKRELDEAEILLLDAQNEALKMEGENSVQNQKLTADLLDISVLRKN